MQIKIIGDVHGKFDAYKKLIEDAEASIQIGDFGFDVHWSKLSRHKIDPDRHKIIPGNHDDYAFLKEDKLAKNWTFGKEYGEVEFFGLNFFFLRGAWSIDKKYRTPEYDWWEAEELTSEELDKAYDLYVKAKPEVMITHECPGQSFDGISQIIFGAVWHPNRTSQMLQRMWEAHKPNLWIFGHWHKTGIWRIKETEFVCLNELEYIDYEVDDNIGHDVNYGIVKLREQMKTFWLK